MIKGYTEDQWGEEMRVSKSCGKQHPPFGSCNLECPSCHEIGFYGPRKLENDKGEITRKYRACKWCGFWQEAWGNVFNEKGGDPYQCIVVIHKRCGAESAWNDLAGDKWCEKCNDNMDVMIPKDDLSHQKIKEEMNKMHQDIIRIAT